VASGAITFTDADAADLHTASFVAHGSGYLGTFALNTGMIDSADSVAWSFSVSDTALDYLAAGQTLTQIYNVTVDDGHEGSAAQSVTITLVGAADGTTTTTTKTTPGNKGGKKGGGADTASDSGPESTPATFKSHSEQVGMAGDQMPGPSPEEAFSFVSVDGSGHGVRWEASDLHVHNFLEQTDIGMLISVFGETFHGNDFWLV
jgi:VCBS repeat-containing protein